MKFLVACVGELQIKLLRFLVVQDEREEVLADLGHLLRGVVSSSDELVKTVIEVRVHPVLLALRSNHFVDLQFN